MSKMFLKGTLDENLRSYAVCSKISKPGMKINKLTFLNVSELPCNEEETVE